MIPVRWRRVARLAWLILVVLTLAAHLAGIAARLQELRQVCLQPEAVCQADPTTWRPVPSDQAGLQGAGLSLDGFAALEAGKWLFFSSLWITVGGLIFARKSDEWMGLVAAYFLVTFPTSWDGIPAALTRAVPAAGLPVQALQYGVNWGLVFFIALFPNGHLAPRWTRWIVLAYFGASLWLWLPRGWQPAGPAQLALSLGPLAGLVVAQLVRYRRYSTASEQERARWVIYGLCLALALLMVMLSGAFLGGVQLSQGPLSHFASEIFYQLSVALIPLSIGLAILRARLWDIDVLIRRTLVYSVLTGLLALAYFGSVVVLQNLFGAVTGQRETPLVTVLSTLVIAALFIPVRRRVQAFIDRRFYRRKYDAARTLAAFGASLRDETNLDQLTAHLTDVVDETMQPAQVGLWLRDGRQ